MVRPHLKVFWLSKEILQGTVKGNWRKGRQKKKWEETIKGWTGMDSASSARAAKDRTFVESDCCKVICGALTISQSYGLEQT